MLQWMGGSRRKMTTYKNSTGKRQRHYFEERKRKQQQEAGYESYSTGKESCTQNFEDTRSLDLLSLVNISAVTTESSAGELNDARESSDDDDDITLSNEFSASASVRKEIPIPPSGPNEGIAPIFISEQTDTKRLPDQNKKFDQHGSEVDNSKISTVHTTISIIDLLGDGGENSNAIENSEKGKEPHVAFSVEGLGKVETQTPVQSPVEPHRTSQPRSRFPKKARRQPVTSKLLDFGFDDLDSQIDVMLQDHDFPTHVSSGKRCLFPRDVMGVGCYPDDNFFNLRDFQLSIKGSPPQNFLDDDFLHSISNSTRNRNSWNVGPGFSDNDFEDVKESKSFYGDRRNIRSIDKDDPIDSKNPWKQDFNFDSWNLPRKRSSLDAIGNIGFTDSPVHTKDHHTVNHPETFTSYKPWYSPPTTIDNNVRDHIQRFVTEDAKDSEESCTSAAVWCDSRKKSGSREGT